MARHLYGKAVHNFNIRLPPLEAYGTTKPLRGGRHLPAGRFRAGEATRRFSDAGRSHSVGGERWSALVMSDP